MNAPAASNDHSIKSRLEAAISYGSSAEQLTLNIAAIYGNDADAAWEVLALIDQYYRRGRIAGEVFRSVKFHIQSLALGQPTAMKPSPAPSPTVAKPTVPAAQEAAIRVGRVLRGRYVLESPIDYGCTDPVYIALDRYHTNPPEHQQRVAVRFPKQADEAYREFFRAQPLAHPNIARLLEFDRDGELVYYTIEYSKGKLLRDVLDELPARPLPMAYALTIVREAADAIAYAHEHNIMHGALDARSVFITDDGKVRILNFGAPQSEALKMGPRNDLSALACLVYELLVGTHPFQGHSIIVAQELGIRAKSPPGLSRQQWRALQQGLAWSHKRKLLQVKQWVSQLQLHRAQAKLPPLAQLLTSKPRKYLRRSAATIGLLATSAAVLAGATLLDPPVFRTAYEKLLAATTSIADSAPPPEALPASPPAIDPAPPDYYATAPVAAPGPALAAAPVPVPVRNKMIAMRGPAVPKAAAVNQGSDLADADAVTEPADEDRPGRISFLTASFTVPQEAAAARILVRRSSGTHGDVRFSWSTENGSAIAGDDFILSGNQQELIPDGQDSVTLLVPLVSTPRPPGNAEFYVSLDNPTGGASLGSVARVRVVLARP